MPVFMPKPPAGGKRCAASPARKTLSRRNLHSGMDHGSCTECGVVLRHRSESCRASAAKGKREKGRVLEEGEGVGQVIQVPRPDRCGHDSKRHEEVQQSLRVQCGGLIMHVTVKGFAV
jgi:hypothetical protein